MVGWHHRLDGHEYEQALEVGSGQEGLACCSPWGRNESDKTERLNGTERLFECQLLKTLNGDLAACSQLNDLGRETHVTSWRRAMRIYIFVGLVVLTSGNLFP